MVSSYSMWKYVGCNWKTEPNIKLWIWYIKLSCFNSKISKWQQHLEAFVSYCILIWICRVLKCGATSTIRYDLFIWLSRCNWTLFWHFDSKTKILWMRKWHPFNTYTVQLCINVYFIFCSSPCFQFRSFFCRIFNCSKFSKCTQLHSCNSPKS